MKRDSTITAFAELIRDYYGWIAGQTAGHHGTPGRKWAATWRQAAELLVRRHLPLGEYLHFVLREYSPLQPARPNWLLSERVIAAFGNRPKFEDRVLLQKIYCEADRFQIEFGISWWETAAESGDIPPGTREERQRLILAWAKVSPLTLYCLAASESLNDLRDTYQHDAEYQYMTDPDAIDIAFRKMLPSHFGPAARKKYRTPRVSEAFPAATRH